MAMTSAMLSKLPSASILAVTVKVTLFPTNKLLMLHGKLEQPAPETDWIVRLVGVSEIKILLAALGPAFDTSIVNVKLCPVVYGPDVSSVLLTEISATGLASTICVKALSLSGKRLSSTPEISDAEPFNAELGDEEVALAILNCDVVVKPILAKVT